MVFFSVINGGYSHWSAPGQCSRTCGGGISFRTRKCLSPMPGRGCVGSSREVYPVWCNPQVCLTQIRDLRLGIRDLRPVIND
jgi:thrombospondin motif-containing protein 16